MLDFIQTDKKIDWRIILLVFLLLILSLLSNASNDEQDNKVIRIIDGDTIELSNGDKVRYIGIDAPELFGEDRAECFAENARKMNEKLVLGKQVTLKRDVSNKDQYGRLLRYVYIDETMINLALVGEGYAYSKAYPPNTKYQRHLDEAEDAARQKGLGLWSECEI